VVFSPDGRLLASGGADGVIVLWEVVTSPRSGVTTYQYLRRPLTGHTSFITSLAFSPDGKTLASSSADGTVRLWEVKTGQPLGQALSGHSSLVLTVAFSPDGRTLASGGADQTIILWDVSNFKGRTDRPLAYALTGHQGEVSSVTFSPDGQRLASGSEDGLVILWDVATQQPLGLPLVNGDRVWRVAFSPDDKTLASAGRNDGTILLWDVDPTSWQARACRMVNRNLSLAEWQRYRGDEPYQVVCPDAPRPDPESEFISSTPTPTPAPAHPANLSKTAAVVMVEEFESDLGFIQTSPNVKIENGQVKWHFKRNGGEQYVYRLIPPFSGNVRLTARGLAWGLATNPAPGWLLLLAGPAAAAPPEARSLWDMGSR
jgi:WD40 repeat protein